MLSTVSCCLTLPVPCNVSVLLTSRLLWCQLVWWGSRAVSASRRRRQLHSSVTGVRQSTAVLMDSTADVKNGKNKAVTRVFVLFTSRTARLWEVSLALFSVLISAIYIRQFLLNFLLIFLQYSDTVGWATEGHPVCKIWVLVCWCWRFDWSFARLVDPVVTTTSVILSSCKIQNGDIRVLANSGPPGKWPLKWRVFTTWCCCSCGSFVFCISGWM